MAPAARPLKRRPSSSARVAGRCWTSVSGASLSFHAHRHLFAARFSGFERAEMIHGPVGKHRAAVNILTRDWPEDTRIVRADAVIAENEKAVFGHAHGAKIARVFVLWRNVRLGHGLVIHVKSALTNLNHFPGQADHALDERF